MSQNMQQCPRTGTDLRSLPVALDDDPLAQVDTLKVVACPVCRAVYVPTGEQQRQDSAAFLEIAFLSVCRPCFRCQRPACPQCWNPVHHTCAACSEEAHLPFRSPIPSLEGLVFLPPVSTHVSKISFVCQRNGRFYLSEPTMTSSPSQEISSAAGRTTSEPGNSDAFRGLRPDHISPAIASVDARRYPDWLQEVLGQKASEASAPALVNVVQTPDAPIPALPQLQPVAIQKASEASAPALVNMVQTPDAPIPALQPVTIWTQTNPANWSALLPIQQPQPVPVPAEPLAPSAPINQSHPSVPVADSQNEFGPLDELPDSISLFERIENILIVITSILLLAVVLMIVLSISFAQVNAFFFHLLHIDIRTEIAYLLQLR